MLLHTMLLTYYYNNYIIIIVLFINIVTFHVYNSIEYLQSIQYGINNIKINII